MTRPSKCAHNSDMVITALNMNTDAEEKISTDDMSD
jgi:hypothetical protein